MPEIVRTFWTQCENAENFLIIFVQFQCDLQKKKKKKKVITPMEASFSPILCWSPKKKRSFVWVLQLFSAIFATYQSETPWTAAVYGFWRETKTPVFGGRKNAGIRKISVRKCRKKFRTFRTFLRLQGTLRLPIANCSSSDLLVLV